MTGSDLVMAICDPSLHKLSAAISCSNTCYPSLSSLLPASISHQHPTLPPYSSTTIASTAIAFAATSFSQPPKVVVAPSPLLFSYRCHPLLPLGIRYRVLGREENRRQ
ncbi:hypothetical protein GW17_00058810 [Ensete ventricosum]|nr:hypothetical protein GW17_00058810 [Ensete ventricosum]